MRIPQDTAKKARIEIIPMIDTMFFLLIFFMMATISLTAEYVIPVNLPQATGVQEQNRKTAAVTIFNNGKMYLDREEIQTIEILITLLEQQKQIYNQLSVMIHADRGVEHGRVVEVMNALRKSGFEKISFAIDHTKI